MKSPMLLKKYMVGDATSTISINLEFKNLDKEIQLDKIKYVYFETICVFSEDYFIMILNT